MSFRISGRSQAWKKPFSFLAASFAAPRNTGAIVPSSGALARCMARAACAAPGDRVIELGPGTGAVTRRLLAAGVREEDLTLLELNPSFSRDLALQFPKARVLQGDALALLRRLASDGEVVSAIVSGLPLLNFSWNYRLRLQSRALDMVLPEGRLVQFTYATRRPPMPPGTGVKANRTRRIWGNLPPAIVWTYQKEVSEAGKAEVSGC